MTIATSLKKESQRCSPKLCSEGHAASRVTAGIPVAILLYKRVSAGKAAATDKVGCENQQNAKCYFRKAELQKAPSFDDLLLPSTLKTDVILLNLLYLHLLLRSISVGV